MGLSNLTTYKLGDLIELSDDRNSDGVYGIDDVIGISTQKKIIKTKADMNGVSVTSYKILRPNSFAYVPDTSRRGDKISLAFNTMEEIYLVSSISIVFYVKKPDLLLSKYLFMYFNRAEFDRYSRFNSWGSARETFSWQDMCDISITLPDVPTQQKYVDIYDAMCANQKAYEKGLDDLKLTCDAYIEELRRKMPCEKIGPYIDRYDVRNGKNGTKNVMGVSISKEFREPSSKVNKNELANYKVCHPGDIAFVQTTNNEKCFAYAYNNTDHDIVVSSVDEVFSTKKEKLNTEYLSLFFNRKEFDRYARFNSWGSARETFTWNDLVDVQVPIPKMEIQKSIANIHKVFVERKRINEKLKQQIKNICPILIKGAIEEGKSKRG
ncbi:restriction endonuclease subunit S [uncultured Fibrobacter sp.]|uniref:restriction endonuclease subunit S n=1 Tax=uncultured Fibrobacter sp. TaxID=261512 RepID=UPI0025FD99F5|nr:restriction endonuclease subunit S [uncultured Fibrobacter sp.]